MGCSSMLCANGTTCREDRVKCDKRPCPIRALCLPNFQPNGKPSFCEVAGCGAGEICHETIEICGEPPCRSMATCLPTTNHTVNITDIGCSNATCPVGKKCEEVTVACFSPPCLKSVRCVGENWIQEVNFDCDAMRCGPDEGCMQSVEICERPPCPTKSWCIVQTNVDTFTKCPKNQTMTDCLNPCSEDKCPGILKKTECTNRCGQGCACAYGYLRSSDGECYKPKDCPPECGQNEEYRCEKCAGTCKNPEPNCPGPKNKSCKRACICAPGFVKENGKCVTLDSCPDHDHTNITCLETQEYTDCLPKCQKQCSGAPKCEAGSACTPGCFCRSNYKLDSNGDCVHKRKCSETTKCPGSEKWSNCIGNANLCDLTAFSRLSDKFNCRSGCICADGLARDKNGTCVATDKC